ncbi:hypothetical protein F2Q69_00006306 [Brassica cretica]|uniref:Uncharacterized protein n=1 Tax=Brassica cretica TaxID=69181 RepID=A0A8S9P8Q1_BRACR|nr:hypothetical protein F2Q69_00006306 [Brassica cretica]
MINNSAWKPEAGGRTQNRGHGPIPGGMNPEPGGRNLEAGTWRNNMVFFIGLRELHRSIKFLVEFGVGHRIISLATKLPCRQCSDVLVLSVKGSATFVPLIPMTWKWIIRKNHHIGPSKCSEDKTLPPWWGLVGVGRKFDGEAGNVCIDASAHTPDASAAPVAILSLSSGMTSVSVASCVISGLYPDLRQRDVRHVRLALNYVILQSAPGDFEIHPYETHGSWMRFFINRRLYGLSSRNAETGWIFVQKPGGWMDFCPGIRRLDGLSSWTPEAG